MIKKNQLTKIVAFVTAFFVTFTGAGVSSFLPSATTAVTAEASTYSYEEYMCVGDRLYWDGVSSDRKSDNPKVVTITPDGIMTAVGPGTAIVTISEWQREKVTVTLTGDKKLDKKLKKFAKKITKNCKTDLQKVKAIHDWMILYAQYDYKYKRASHTAAGFLANETAVCEGYAKTFSAFMACLNIPCKFIAGDANNGSGLLSHAWNMVKVGKKWYYIDVTWDDPEQGVSDYIGYKYFLVDEAGLSLDHVWDTTGLPQATKRNDEFVTLMGSLCTSADEAADELIRQTEEGVQFPRVIAETKLNIGILDVLYLISGQIYYYEPYQIGKYTVYTIVNN